jgi:hypothetical protein
MQHGIALDGSREIVVEVDALLPSPLTKGSFFEVILNREGVWSDGWFGVSLQGGAEEGVADCICVRRDSGPRVLAEDHLAPDRWYRLRLAVTPGSLTGTVTVADLSAGEVAGRPVAFAGGQELRLAEGEAWRPALADLDTLILRLGGAAQVSGVRIVNE